MFCVSPQTKQELAQQQQGVSNTSQIVKFDTTKGVSVGNKHSSTGY